MSHFVLNCKLDSALLGPIATFLEENIMRSFRLALTLLIPVVALALLLVSLSLAAPATSSTPDTFIPMGTAQANVQRAYLDVFVHLYGGGRVHWAASALSDPVVRPGDFIIPGGLTTPIIHTDVTVTLPLSRAYALHPGKVAVLRSTVVITDGQNQMVAMWELADVRQFLDGYLLNKLPYEILDETSIVTGLQTTDVLIIPTLRADALLTVTQSLSDSGALAAIKSFVENGGTLYAQSNGAVIAEAAGLLPAGTVDVSTPLHFTAEGQLTVQQPDSPLTWSWITPTLYVLTEPTLHAADPMDVIATFADANDAPAIVRVPVGEGAGQVILVAGHPTDEAHRVQAPIILDAILSGLTSRVELTGDAIQTFNPAYPAHEFPAYERVPISVTLAAANLWDITATNTIVTEVVRAGYEVLLTSITPAPSSIFTVTTPTTQTFIVWNLGDLAPQQTIELSYLAESDPQALAAGIGTFSTGEMFYLDPDRGPVTVSHQPFVLTAQMAARLVGDRDLEADRHYRIPDEGLYLDVALPLENKEATLAHHVVVTDWVFLIHPIVDLENQHVILNANDGETIWLRNEPFLWGSKYPVPTNATAPTQTYALDDWQGDQCVFTSTYGIHIDPAGPGYRPTTNDLGSFITIPPTYSQYITVTANHELLLPCLPLTFDLGEWPGYWYEEPAVRFGVHSRELFSRTVVFHGTPREDTVVMPYDAGSIYVVAGSDPVPFRDYLTATVPYVAAAPSAPGVTYQDVWSRTHFTPLRGSFYDVWDWDSCATCGGWREQHAALNLTFGIRADLDRDGIPETPVREIPTRLPDTQLTLMAKSYSIGPWTIPADMNVIDLPIFHGLGVQIVPSNTTWFDSFRPATGHTQLISITQTDAYDHLMFQQDVPPGVAEIFYIDGQIKTYDFNREGMFKLHDGARLVYRQMGAGPNRYEVYDSHVHSVMGSSSDGRVASWAGPTAVSVYGDDVYFTFDVNDRYDPRPFVQDPYMNSWGYGDFVATSYVGGREDKTLFHSLIQSNDRTRARISLDNNTGVTLTNVSVSILTPDWITATLLYLDPATTPEPIWPELSFLNVSTIHDAWRGVYYFDLQIGEVPGDVVGSVITLPVQIQVAGLPAGYVAPPLVLAIERSDGAAPDLTLGTAHDLVVTTALSSRIDVLGAAIINDAEQSALQAAAGVDAQYLLSDTATSIFLSLTQPISFTLNDQMLKFQLPAELQQLPLSQTLHLAAHVTITHANHGPNLISDGGTICYTDPFGVRWCDQAHPLIVEATGAAVSASYFCTAVSGNAHDDGVGSCTIPPDQTSTLDVRVTLFNAGDKLARDVTTTLELPGGVISSDPVDDLIWDDIEPGGWRTQTVRVTVTPNRAAIVAAPSGWQLPIVQQTVGQFTDSATERVIRGQFAGVFKVNVTVKPRVVYLPLLFRGFEARSDLKPLALIIEPNNGLTTSTPVTISVVVQNVGTASASEFWVDLYVDPTHVPGINDLWNNLCSSTVDCYGGAWGVTQAVAPGQIITLTSSMLWPEYSYWLGYFAALGTHQVYVYVDVWNPGTTTGAVLESNESNNLIGPWNVTVGGGAQKNSVTGEIHQPRPVQP